MICLPRCLSNFPDSFPRIQNRTRRHAGLSRSATKPGKAQVYFVEKPFAFWLASHQYRWTFKARLDSPIPKTVPDGFHMAWAFFGLGANRRKRVMENTKMRNEQAQLNHAGAKYARILGRKDPVFVRFAGSRVAADARNVQSSNAGHYSPLCVMLV